MENLYERCNSLANLTYDQIKVLPQESKVLNQEYLAYGEGKFCILSNYASSDTPTGWKFHIAVDEKHCAEAFNIIADIAMKNKCPWLKVLKSDQSLDTAQTGKAIVLYDTGKEDWHEIIPQMERALRAAKINPHPVLTNLTSKNNLSKDRAIPNSRYFLYRNDKGVNGKYIDAYTQARSYNDSGKPDPFSDLQIPRLTLAKKLNQLTEGKWKDYRQWKQAYTISNTPITRYPIDEISNQDVLKLFGFLYENKIPYSLHDSQVMGQTVRISGHENIKKLQNTLVGEQNKLPMSTILQGRNKIGR